MNNGFYFVIIVEFYREIETELLIFRRVFIKYFKP